MNAKTQRTQRGAEKTAGYRWPLPAPFPYFGGKSIAAPDVWRALGDPPNYVEPFFGSGAAIFCRPTVGGIETVNDRNGFVANFWRALCAAPHELCEMVDGPVIECNLHARNAWLMGVKPHLQSALEGSHSYFDLTAAAFWVSGMCEWIGARYAAGDGPWQACTDSCGIMRLVKVSGFAGRGIRRNLPHLGTAGSGSHRKLPLSVWFEALAQRLHRVRIVCGEWSRCVTPSVTTKNGLTGVFLDPPYSDYEEVYDAVQNDADQAAAEWAFANGRNPLFRIVLCGPRRKVPRGWRVVRCKNRKGYAKNNENRARETLMLSPHCLT